jgi:hypothetical protein
VWDQARKQKAPHAHAAHEGSEQNHPGNGGGAGDQWQQLQPDHLTNEGGETAAEKQE